MSRKYMIAAIAILLLTGCSYATEEIDTSTEEEQMSLMETILDSANKISYSMDQNESPTKVDIAEKLWVEDKLKGLKHLTEVSKDLYDIDSVKLTYEDSEISIDSTMAEFKEAFDVTLSSNSNIPSITQMYGVRVYNVDDTIINQTGAINVSDEYMEQDNCNIGSLEGSLEYLKYINASYDENSVKSIEINGIHFGDNMSQVFEKLNIDKYELDTKYEEYTSNTETVNDKKSICDMYSVSEGSEWYVKFTYYIQKDVDAYIKVDLDFTGDNKGLNKYSLDCTPYTSEGFSEIYRNINLAGE